MGFKSTPPPWIVESLHAGVICEGHQKDKRERLCRCISRPAVAIPRLSQSSTGKVVYTLKARGSRHPTGMERHRSRSIEAAIRQWILLPGGN
jgi:hypothetical protein